MAEYYLSFRPSQPLTVERWAEVLSAFVGAPVTTYFGDLSGNPRDFWSRSVTITANQRDRDVTLELALTQTFMSTDDPAPVTDGATVILKGPTYATRMATWQALH